jgi:predicted DNA-binding protein
MPSKEQESSSILSIRLPDELIQRLDRYLDWWATLRRVKASRNAVLREALSQWLEAHEDEAGLVHAPTLRHQFWNAVHRLAPGSHEVRIHRLRQTLQWPRERFDAMLEALRAEQHIGLEEGLPGAMSARDIQDSYHVHGRLSITLHWQD